MLTTFYYTITHTGYGYNIGIAGKIFGRDHLAIYYEQSTNTTINNQVNRQIGLSYKLYFY